MKMAVVVMDVALRARVITDLAIMVLVTMAEVTMALDLTGIPSTVPTTFAGRVAEDVVVIAVLEKMVPLTL